MAEDFITRYILEDNASAPLGAIDRALTQNQVAISATDAKAKMLSSTYANMKTTAIEGGLAPALVTPKGVDKGLVAAQNDALAAGEMWLGRSAVAAAAYDDRIKSLVIDTQALGRAQADVATKSPRLFERMEGALAEQDVALARAAKQKPLIYDRSDLTQQFNTWENQMQAQNRRAAQLIKERQALYDSKNLARESEIWSGLSGLEKIKQTAKGGWTTEGLQLLKKDFDGFLDSIRKSGNAASGLDTFWRGIGRFFGAPIKTGLKETKTLWEQMHDSYAKATATPGSGAAASLNFLDKLKLGFTNLGNAADRSRIPTYQAAVGFRSVASALTVQNWQAAVYDLSLVGRGMAGIAMYAAVAATAIVLAGVAVYKLLQVGVRVEGITTAFNNMTAAANISGAALRRSLQETSNYAVASVDLMRIANRAMLAGGKQLADDLPQILEAARLASLANGKDMMQIFDDLVKGMVRGSPRLIDNADIYLKLADSIGAYSKKTGIAVRDMTALNKQEAVTSAIVGKLPQLQDQVGMSAETSAEKMQSLGAAIKDVSGAAGLLLTQTFMPDFIASISKGIRDATTRKAGTNAYVELYYKFTELDSGKAQKAFSDFQYETEAIQKQFTTSGDEMAYFRQLAAIVEYYQRLMAKDFPTRSLTQMPDALEGGTQRMTEWQVAAEAAGIAQGNFTDAMQETIDKATGLAKWGDLAGQFEVLAKTPLPQPEIANAPLQTDTTAWLKYLDVLGQVNPKQVETYDRVRESIVYLQQQEQAVLSNASAMGSGAAALNYIAQAAFGVGAGVLDLINNFAKLAPATQNAIMQMNWLGAALDALQAKAAKGVSLDMQIKGVEQAQADIRSAAMSLVGIMPEKDIQEFERRANADLTADIAQHLRTRGDITQFELDLMLRDHVRFYQDLTEEERNYYTQSAQRAKESAKITKKSADEVRSAIENALSKGLEVTQGDMLATKAGIYRDKAMESARRLNAIAERGFEELKVHPDWAGALKIPPDVLASGEDALKAWAAATSESVQNLTRPDLINWDAFIGNYKQSLQDEAAKKLTLDIALGKLKAAGLLEGKSEEAARKEVLKMLGLDEPEVKFATYFPEATTDDPAVRAVQNYLRSGDPVEVQYQWVASGQQMGLIPGGMPITPDQTAQLEWANAMAKAQGAWPQSPTTLTPKLGPPTPADYVALQGKVDTGLAAAPVNIVAGLGFNAANLETYRNSVAAYFMADPVTIETAPAWTMAQATNYRDGLAAYFEYDPISIDTDLYDPEAMINLYKGRVETWFTEYPVTVDTVLGGTLESIDLYRDGVEGLFRLQPLQIMTQLVQPESSNPFGAPLPKGQGEPYQGQQANYYGGKVAGLASMTPYTGLATGTDMAKPGQDIAGALYTSFDLAIKAQTPGAAVASAWTANFASAAPMFAAIGNSAGNQVGDATVSAILNKVGGVVQKLAEVIAPEVAAILGQKGNGSLA